MNIGAVIRKLRDERGWNQDELAFRTGTTAANISRIENGKHGPSEMRLKLLAREFGCHVYQLIALAEGVESPVVLAQRNKDEETLLDCFRAMGQPQQELFKAIAAEFARHTGRTEITS